MLLKNINPAFCPNIKESNKRFEKNNSLTLKKDTTNKIDDVIPLSTIISFGKNRKIKEGISISN